MTQRIVITGANRGLGLELTRVYVERGDEVIAACRRPGGADELCALTDRVHQLDTGDEASIDALGAALAFETVDVLYNNAGLDARAFGVPDGERDVLTLSATHFEQEMRVNAVGPMLLARALLGALRRAQHARIVNVSSQIGSMVVSAAMGRDVGYAASKAALNMITVKLAWRLRADAITAVAVHPGYLRTAMGAGRLGAGADLEAADAAASIVALVDSLTPEHSGRFYRWDGSEHPW